VSESTKPEQDATVQALLRFDPEAVSEVTDFRDELTLEIPAPKLRTAAEYLKGEADLKFEFLSDISVVDRHPIEPRFELNYHMVSFLKGRALRVRVRIPGGARPTVDTVTPVWPTANWHEREVFDLFGIYFAGHPDLSRILMPDDWEGFPLRRDYPTEGYR
jgi:NADH-quinone oxidoreductase subunit C